MTHTTNITYQGNAFNVRHNINEQQLRDLFSRYVSDCADKKKEPNQAEFLRITQKALTGKNFEIV